MAPSPDKGKVATYDPAPRTEHYEFGGGLGALGVTLAVPFFTYWLAFACTADQCPPWPMRKLVAFHSNGLKAMQDPTWWESLWDWEAAGVYLAWYFWTVACALALPGKEIEGVKLRNGKKLKYTMNGESPSSLLSPIIVRLPATSPFGPSALLYIPNHWAQLISAALAWSAFLATFVYYQSYIGEQMLALGGNTPNPFYNASLAFRSPPAFNEMRPGLILWIVIDLSMVAYQYSTIARVTDSMILTVAFHSWYVLDAEFNEPAILTTMDITTDGFGFMLSVGDLLWVPFTYSYTAYYLAFHPKDIGLSGCAGVLAVQLVGYWIFRSSNNEKNEFRSGRNPKNLTSMQTERGTRLLTSGWWGMSRHPNYLGDWIMAWAWCLPCGFSTPLPYFYPVYFGILLAHRQTRDDEACAKKYKKDWETYKRLVPWRIIPYVY
ncbi:C-14 sterol reductase [Rhodotorula toruloides]|uniref:Delta(14)-sterol reductase ERG24 n=1 Tax=Rhodotorula toruloides TaxID=5286 RepID=A0A511KEG4_RHOTO|nr:C-14 sterol reductase [Rhodotorula toruloides]